VKALKSDEEKIKIELKFLETPIVCKAIGW